MSRRRPIRTPSPPRPELDRLVAEGLERGITEEEYLQQKISWVYGNSPFDADITRERAEEAVRNFRMFPHKKTAE